MKFYLLSSILLLLLSCDSRTKQNTYSSDFDFLLGDWERTNSKEGQLTMEHWKIISATEYRGHGYTLEKRDTTFQEHMLLIKKNGIWNLEVSGPNADPVIFEITSSATNKLTAENPIHDFPKKITYSYFDDTLSAKVSNEDMEIPFIFWRAE